MARTNLHEQATRLLDALAAASHDGVFEGALRTIAVEAGLNSARSAEAVKLLEELGRIEVVQRGRRERKTIINIRSTQPVERDDVGPRATTTRSAASRLDYSDIGQAVVDRLLALGRDDALRAAQVEAFANETAQARSRIAALEEELSEANERETQLRVKLHAAEEALERAEENLRKAFAGTGRPAPATAASVPDDDARAVLDILRRAN